MAYFDIVVIEEPDENGNVVQRYKALSSPPEYPEIRPKDMSTSNQIKAGAQLQVVDNFTKGDRLNNSDVAEGDLFKYGDRISEAVELAKAQQQQQQQEPLQQQQQQQMTE